MVKRMLKDYWHFLRTLGTHDVVHLNPSMSRKPFFRDMVFMYLVTLRHKPTVVFWHGWDWEFFGRVKSKYMTLMGSTFGKADAMIVLSSEMEKALKEILPASKVYRKTTCPDVSLKSGLNEAAIGARYEDGHPIRLLFLARLERQKGIYECLSAFEKLKARYPELSLTIAGDGSEEGRVRGYIEGKQLKDIKILGFVSGQDKRVAFTEADIYLFPSYYPEGLPVSLLEAMSCGLPVLTSDIGGIKDEFIDGKMGYFVSPRNDQELADKLRYLLENPSLMKEMALFNFRYANDKYAAPKVARSIEVVYEEVAIGKAAKLGSESQK